MRPLITIAPEAKSLVACSLRKRRGLFWSLSVFPIAASVTATIIYPRLWFAYLLQLLGAFLFLLVIVQGFELRVSQSNWGRYEKERQPVRYWISQSIWIGMWMCVSLFPVFLAIQKASK